MKKTLKILSLLWVVCIMLNSLAFATDRKAINYDCTDAEEVEAYNYVCDVLNFDTNDEDLSLHIGYIDNKNRIYQYIIYDYGDLETWECTLGEYYYEFSYCIFDYDGTYVMGDSYVMNGKEYGSICEMDEKGLVPDEVFERLLSKYNGYRKSEIILGDVNHDLTLDIVDVVYVRYAIVNKFYVDKNKFIFSDMNGDKEVDIADVVMMRKAIVG